MWVQIYIKDHLAPSWRDWLENLQITHREDGTSLLMGTLPDQAALYGVLWKLRDLSVTLLSLESSPFMPELTLDGRLPKATTISKGEQLMQATALLREQIQQAHGFLAATMNDVTSEQAHWAPPGTANPIAATYVHAIASEDLAINMVLKGGAPLYATEWAEKTGISEIQPLTTFEWARRVQIDLPTVYNYAQAVHAATDAYLATLTDEDLSRVLDLTNFGLGQMSVGTILNRMVLGHIDNMCGEISVLKGLQGAKGYPM